LAERDAIVAEVAEAVGLAEGENGVRAVLAALARLEPVSVSRISRVAALPVPIVASVCGELRKRQVVAQQRPAQLTAAGRDLFGGARLRLEASGCPECLGRGSILPDELAPSVRDVARLAREAPAQRVELDQCQCSVETKLRRVLALHEADALVGRRLLLLGDDDLVSLALESVVRRFGSAKTVAQLTVLDVDPAIVAFLRERFKKARLPWSCLQHDLREPLPVRLRASFDTVLTDPPYTVAGARLFLSRAAEAIRPDGRVFLSFACARADDAQRVQRQILAMGFEIESLVRDFNRYLGAGVLAGTSHLYRLRAGPASHPVVAGRFEGPLYTAECR
jgi:predicted methyltransferase